MRVLRYLFLMPLLTVPFATFAQTSVYQYSPNNGISKAMTADASVAFATLVKLDSSHNVVPAANSDTNDIYGVSASAGSSGGSVLVIRYGDAWVLTDNACTAGQSVITSTTVAPQGHCTSAPGAAQVVGTATQTTGASGTVSVDASIFSSTSIPGGGGFTNPMTAIGDMIGGGASGTPTRVPAGITGQQIVATNAATPSFTSPGLADGNGASPVTSSTYTIQCDSATAIIDRMHMLRFRSGASSVTVPSSTASGCTGNFAAILFDDGAGTLTVSRSGSDTFSIFNGSTNSDSQTSFTMTNGQYATVAQGATGIWEVWISPTPGGGASATNTTNASANSNLLCDNNFSGPCNGAGTDIGTTETAFNSTLTTTSSYVVAGRAYLVQAILDVHCTGNDTHTLGLRLTSVSGTLIGQEIAANSGACPATWGGNAEKVEFLIQGTAAAGSSVNVETGGSSVFTYGDTAVANPYGNQVTQPVAIPTNSAFVLVLTYKFSASGNGDYARLRQFNLIPQ